jgi:hypothetical protein
MRLATQAAVATLWAGAAAAVCAAAPAKPSREVEAALRQIVAAADHGGAPFVVIDKKQATLWLFDGAARVRAGTAVLLGAARGDESVPGIGERPLASIAPAERTTPAGRFVAELGVNHQGEDIIWVDYDAAVSMHRLRQVNPAQRRAQRLASPSPADNRISYGCINVPAAFFDRHLRPWVRQARPPVLYVLPEVRPLHSLLQPR